jgi:hypothetical protein
MTAVIVGDVYYVFANGEPHWTTYQSDPDDMAGHKGWGERGMFVFSFNHKTLEYKLRILEGKAGNKTGLAAVEDKFGEFPQFTPASWKGQ